MLHGRDHRYAIFNILTHGRQRNLHQLYGEGVQHPDTVRWVQRENDSKHRIPI